MDTSYMFYQPSLSVFLRENYIWPKYSDCHSHGNVHRVKAVSSKLNIQTKLFYKCLFLSVLKRKEQLTNLHAVSFAPLEPFMSPKVTNDSME